MVKHMVRMMGLSEEEATAFVAMHQSVLKPFLHGVSPPPTPEPLPVPPCYHNISPAPLHYKLLDSKQFPLPPPAPLATSPVEDHVSYPPSPIRHPEDDLDHFPSSNWPSNLPSPTSSPDLDNVPVLQAFIQTVDDPVESQIQDESLVEDMVLVLYEGSHQLDVARMNAKANEEHATPTPSGLQPDVFPGPGWIDNWTEAGTRHFFIIAHGEEECIAPFIQYDLEGPFPKLLATHGRGCTVHSRPLHARASKDDGVVGCMPDEERIFFKDESHTDAVDWAIRQEEDPTLRGEVQYLRSHRRSVLRKACRIAALHESLEIE